MLINPDVKMESPVIWICDKYGAVLNQQEGFAEALGEWECRECGFRGKLDKSEIYISDEEYEADCRNPYKGMSQEALMALMVYKEKESINGRADIMLVEDRDTGEKYVEKILKTYDITVYNNPMQIIYGNFHDFSQFIQVIPIRNSPICFPLCYR